MAWGFAHLHEDLRNEISHWRVFSERYEVPINMLSWYEPKIVIVSETNLDRLHGASLTLYTS